MENLVFSLNATLPVALLIAVGYFIRRVGFISDGFAAALNQFVYVLGLPFLIYSNLAQVDFEQLWDLSYVFLCFSATLAGFVGITAVSFPLVKKDRALRGEFIQSCYRGSAAILTFAYIQNIYGAITTTSLMILGAVPLYNVLAVTVLQLTDPKNTGARLDWPAVRKVLVSLTRNPIILGVVVGMLGALFRVRLPAFVDTTIANLADMASPLALIGLGASVDVKAARSTLKLTAVGSAIKLLALPLIFLPVALVLGLTGEKLTAFLIMLGTPTTVACYVMARNTNHEGVLTSSMVVATTTLGTFTMTFLLYLLRVMDLI